MQAASLTLRSVSARPVVLPLKRPVVARIATIADWPLILIDLHTEEGVVGRSYLEPYTAKAMRYLVPALQDLGELLKGQRGRAGRAVRPRAQIAAFRRLRGHVDDRRVRARHGGLGRAGQAAGVPLCVLLGGSVGPVRAYNSNGLWLQEPAAVAAEARGAARRGRVHGAQAAAGTARIADDLAALEAVRGAVGEDMALMVDFNQGLDLAEALSAATRSTTAVSPGSRSRWSTTISTATRGSPPS